jgi:O-methyltransferase involved in polyketide biosynthesis
MTALVSCFARAYHSKNYKYKIYNDYLAEKILSEDEYDNISDNMKKGINFFNPSFKGTDEEALRWIVDNQLSPSVLARSVFTEAKLKNEIRLGAKQYLIFASGYDSSGYKNYKDLSVFEIDKSEMIKDKINRLNKANINHENINYISDDQFKILILKYDAEHGGIWKTWRKN